MEKTPILIIECDEPEGLIKRNVYHAEITLDFLHTFWTKAKKFPTLFAQTVNDDFGQFCEIFLRKDAKGEYVAKGLIYVIDDFVGVFYMTDMYWPDDATVHYTFFDRRQKGRVPLVKAMLRHVFEIYKFNRLSASLPMYVNKYAFAFVNMCGFKEEGRKRECRKYQGEYFDETLYGILSSEVLAWEVKPKPLVVAQQQELPTTSIAS